MNIRQLEVEAVIRMNTNQEFVDELMVMLESQIREQFVLSRMTLDTVDSKSAVAQADDIRRSIPPMKIQPSDSFLVARDCVNEVLAAWVDVADKAFGVQSEEP